MLTSLQPRCPPLMHLVKSCSSAFLAGTSNAWRQAGMQILLCIITYLPMYLLLLRSSELLWRSCANLSGFSHPHLLANARGTASGGHEASGASYMRASESKHASFTAAQQGFRSVGGRYTVWHMIMPNPGTLVHKKVRFRQFGVIDASRIVWHWREVFPAQT